MAVKEDETVLVMKAPDKPKAKAKPAKKKAPAKKKPVAKKSEEAPAKKKMRIVETRGATYDFCPKAHFHDRTKGEAKDSDNGVSGCPECKTTWSVEEAEPELSDAEKEHAKVHAAAVRRAENGASSQAEYDGNQASNYIDADEGANTTENT